MHLLRTTVLYHRYPLTKWIHMSEWKSNKYWRNRPVEERVRNLRIPPRYRSCTFDSFEDVDGVGVFKTAVRKYADSPDRHLDDGMGMYLFGKTGVGKTHLAVSLLRHLVANNELSGMFVSYDVFVEMIHDSRNNDGELPEMYGDPNLLKYMRRVYDILVIDNLNADRLTDYMAKTVGNLIEARYDMKLPTIITTEINPDKLTTLYSDRMASIVRRSCYTIGITGNDYRLKD